MKTSLASRVFTILRGAVYSASFVWLWVWIAGRVRSWDAQIPVTLPAWLRPVGFVVAGAGALLTALCIATFVTRGRGTPFPLDPPREFVVSGPYRWVRNPMYVGAAAVILGAGLVLSSPSIVLLAVAFLLLMHAIVVLYEEPTLAEKFGASYRRYKAQVGRWLIRKPVGT